MLLNTKNIARSAAQLITVTPSHRAHACSVLTVKNDMLFSNFRCVLMETETLYRIIMITQVTAAVENVTVTKCCSCESYNYDSQS
jgi:hypothetical protein